MRTLELKDIVGYLPYDLRCLVSKWNEPQCLFGAKANGIYFFGEIGIADLCLDDIKPILHPMSDISKEIIVKGYNKEQPFIPVIKIAEFCNPHMTGWKIDGKGRAYTRDNGWPQWVSPEQVEMATFDIFDLLNKWHFDYRGLIDEGLAVDINKSKLHE